MMEYQVMTDEKLVELYQTERDQEAFNTLFQRYEGFLKNRAEQSAFRSNLDINAVQHKIFYQFWQAVRKYNPDRGASFKTFVCVKLRSAAHDVLMEKYRKKTDEEGRRLMKEQPLQSAQMENLAVEMDLTDRLVVEDIFNYLKTKDEVYPIVFEMILQGYTYEEIGAHFRRKGSPEAVRNWVKRLKKKIKEYVSEYYAMV